MAKIAITLFNLIAIFLAVSLVDTVEGEDDTLVLLHVLFRHGNRTPDKMSLYPNDPYLSETYEPIGYSQLTLKGKLTEYQIGKYIREQYGNLIPAQYTPDVVYAISTNMKRTKMSLELVLSALFPPLPTDEFVPLLPWQPLPFNIEQAEGILGVASLYCANYINAYFKYLLSKEAQKICDSYKNLYQELSTFSGAEVRTPRQASGIYFTLKSEDDYGLKVPEWTQGLYPDLMEEAASVDYEFSTANPTLKKLSAGFLLKKILQDSVSKQNGTLSDERKVFLYSAHEFNVATMLRTLNVFYRHVPPFGATIYFEIHNINGVYGLKLFYQDYTQLTPKLLTIPGCLSFCPLDDVYRLVEDVLPGESDVCSSTDEVF
ncbi:hypothetical protein Zmor_000406 [Zophobas morio]|uniref:acid phosphatase n=1 Tax=Zophobas morio TaxID=2755281 RepID=A0AA38MR94_9CUCU|nr:hypothetical protein Zmor_000406 [Zophobas morio]